MKGFIFYSQVEMKPCKIGPGFDVLGGDAIVVEIMIVLNYLLWKISHKYKSRESNVRNSYVSITQRQQLSIHGLSYFIYATTYLPTVVPDYSILFYLFFFFY